MESSHLNISNITSRSLEEMGICVQGYEKHRATQVDHGHLFIGTEESLSL